MSEIWGVPSPYKWGPKNHLYRLHNLTTSLTVYIVGMKHDIHNRASALAISRGFLHRLKMTLTLVHRQLKVESSLLPTICKFCILIHCQASQTQISKRNSIKLCQRVDS